MASSQAPQSPQESKLKSLLIVLVTIAALVVLVARPFFDGGRQGGEENADGEVKKTAQEDNQAPRKAEIKKADADSESNYSDKQKNTKSSGNSDNGATRDDNSKEKIAPNNRSKKGLKTGGSNQTRGPPSGELEKVSQDLYRSPAGLLYGPGSRDNHRLTHVLKHAKDDLSKPIHGVFDGTQNEIIALIDQAYLRVKKRDASVSESRSGNRIALTIDFGRRIGYVGGQTGKRKKNPVAEALVLVLDGERVITAYPK